MKDGRNMFMRRSLRLPSFKRAPRRRSPDFASFGRDAFEVIGARTAQGFTGTLSAKEARLMIAEKQSAAVNAYFAFVQAIVDGNASTAPAASFAVFQKAVSANHRRLVRRKILPF